MGALLSGNDYGVDASRISCAQAKRLLMWSVNNHLIRAIAALVLGYLTNLPDSLRRTLGGQRNVLQHPDDYHPPKHPAHVGLGAGNLFAICDL